MKRFFYIKDYKLDSFLSSHFSFTFIHNTENLKLQYPEVSSAMIEVVLDVWLLVAIPLLVPILVGYIALIHDGKTVAEAKGLVEG